MASSYRLRVSDENRNVQVKDVSGLPPQHKCLAVPSSELAFLIVNFPSHWLFFSLNFTWKAWLPRALKCNAVVMKAHTGGVTTTALILFGNVCIHSCSRYIFQRLFAFKHTHTYRERGGRKEREREREREQNWFWTNNHLLFPEKSKAPSQFKHRNVQNLSAPIATFLKWHEFYWRNALKWKPPLRSPRDPHPYVQSGVDSFWFIQNANSNLKWMQRLIFIP